MNHAHSTTVKKFSSNFINIILSGDIELYLAIILFIFLEIALLLLSATDFSMTRAGLIRHGTDDSKATYLALAIVIFMFLIWSVILNLAPLHKAGNFLLFTPVMIMIMVVSYGGAGQWILIELAGVDASRQAARELTRDIKAYLRPSETPAQILSAMALSLEQIKNEFKVYTQKELEGTYSGFKNPGPATERLGSVTAMIESAEDVIRSQRSQWIALTEQASKELNILEKLIDTAGSGHAINTGEVERTLNNVVTQLSTFPFSAVRPTVVGALTSALQTAQTPPALPAGSASKPDVQERYNTFYKELARRVAVVDEMTKGLLDQIDQFKIGEPPRISMKSTREIVFQNPSAYAMDIAHSIALIIAPFIYACGPAQIIHRIFSQRRLKMVNARSEA